MHKDKRLEMDVEVFLGRKNVVVGELDLAVEVLAAAFGVELQDIIMQNSLRFMVFMMMPHAMFAFYSGITEAARQVMVFGAVVELHVPSHRDKQHREGHPQGTDLQQTLFHAAKIRIFRIFAAKFTVMADGYLEKRYEEVFGAGAKKTVVKHTSIETLMEKNRSYRGYQQDYVVKRDMLERIVAVNTKIASAKNQQVLRFKLVTKETGADIIVQNMKLGGLLPELHLPFPGTEPEAFIIICSTIPENKFVDIDLGIAAQSMLLKVTEMGLNGIMIGAFNKAKITEAFDLPYEPLLILAIGKGNEKIKLQAVDAGDKLAYYRDNDGVQYVPKIRWEQLLL